MSPEFRVPLFSILMFQLTTSKLEGKVFYKPCPSNSMEKVRQEKIANVAHFILLTTAIKQTNDFLDVQQRTFHWRDGLFVCTFLKR